MGKAILTFNHLYKAKSITQRKRRGEMSQIYTEIMCECCEEYFPLIEVRRITGITYCRKCFDKWMRNNEAEEIIEE